VAGFGRNRWQVSSEYTARRNDSTLVSNDNELLESCKVMKIDIFG
jgi:hypothetical protein